MALVTLEMEGQVKHFALWNTLPSGMLGCILLILTNVEYILYTAEIVGYLQ